MSSPSILPSEIGASPRGVVTDPVSWLPSALNVKVASRVSPPRPGTCATHLPLTSAAKTAAAARNRNRIVFIRVRWPVAEKCYTPDLDCYDVCGLHSCFSTARPDHGAAARDIQRCGAGNRCEENHTSGQRFQYAPVRLHPQNPILCRRQEGQGRRHQAR